MSSSILNYTWVPCNVRFPEEGGKYLVTFEADGELHLDFWYFSVIYGWVGVPEDWKIHAWLPSPKPYEWGGYAEFHVKTIEEMMEEARTEESE